MDGEKIIEDGRIVVCWKTKDGREHHQFFASDEINPLNKVEAAVKDLWQRSAITNKDKHKIESMSIVEGVRVGWEKEEMPVVKSVKLSIRADSPFLEQYVKKE